MGSAGHNPITGSIIDNSARKDHTKEQVFIRICEKYLDTHVNNHLSMLFDSGGKNKWFR